jgi:Secretion system C-terminal sorting domain
MDHVSTEVPWPTYAKYSEHSNRTDFLAKMTALGENPRYVKLFSVANGNMEGLGQTRLWDGADRAASDRLLDISARLDIKILRRRFNFAGLDVRLNTDPNGNGNIGYIQAGHYWFKFKIRLFRIKIITGFNSHTNKHWDAQTRPVSTSAGGVMTFNDELLGFIQSKPQLNYSGNGDWINPSGNGSFGVNSRFSTDGFHWSFVPTSSALNDGPFINIKYDSLGALFTMNSTPFDVCKGWPGDSVVATGIATQWQQFANNAFLRNRFHTEVLNQALRNNSSTPATILEYDISKCLSMTPQPNRRIFVLNREIGDDKMYLENRVLPWQGLYTSAKEFNINKRSPFYHYAGMTAGVDAIPSTYSKRNPFIILAPSGLAYFNTMPGSPINYLPPMSGNWGKTLFAIEPCCEFMGTNAVQRKPQNPPLPDITEAFILIWPNPANKELNIFSNSPIVDFILIDNQGKVLQLVPVDFSQNGTSNTYKLELPNILLSGLYTIRTTAENGMKQNKKIIIN